MGPSPALWSWGAVCSSHSGALGVVGRRLQRPRPTRLSGEVEAVLSARASGAEELAEEDDDPPQQAERRPHPPGVQGEAEGHQPAVAVGPHREPDGGDDPTQSCNTGAGSDLGGWGKGWGRGRGGSHPRRGRARPPHASAAAGPRTSRSAA